METIKNWFYTSIRFLREVKVEMKKVNWLSTRSVVNYTILVISITVVAGVYLGALDLFFQWLLTEFIL